MKCPYCNTELVEHKTRFGESFKVWCECPNENCVCGNTGIRDVVWRDLITGKQAQSELNYYKGLNCPTVVEKQMQTITELAKELKQAQDALKVATKCINWTIDTFEKGLEHEADIVEYCELSLWKIDEITQQDTKE